MTVANHFIISIFSKRNIGLYTANCLLRAGSGHPQEYTTGQKEISEQPSAMEVRLQKLKNSGSNIARFIENAKRCREIPELTTEILRTFMKHVEVGERAEKYSRTAHRRCTSITAALA